MPALFLYILIKLIFKYEKIFQKNKVLKIAIITYLVAIFPFGFVKTDYYFMSPGPPLSMGY